MGWTTLHLEVTTPLFNGGADPKQQGPSDSDAGVRVPSLRGAMRFWFRALAGVVVGPDVQRLARVERRVFGSTEAASPVKLRIPRQPLLSRPGHPDFIHDPLGGRVVYLLGQGLGDLRQRRVIRPYVAPKQRFDLQLRFTGGGEEGALVVAALWLLCAYGGVGARTRRGFGGLRIIGADGPLPPPWDQTTVLSPGLEHYESLRYLWPSGPIERCMPSLIGLCKPRTDWSSPPTYPVLSKHFTKAGTSGGDTFRDWPYVLAHAGEQLRWFRASKDYPQAPYPEPKIKTPEWDEVVHGGSDHFGLGALGLPVVYKDTYEVNADRGGPSHAEPLRRASPLWLRPVGAGSRWRLLSFAFQGEFLPSPAVKVHLWHGGSQRKLLRVEHQDVVERTNRWIETMRQDGTFVRNT